MIGFYLNIYGPLLAFGLLVVSSVILCSRGFLGPALLIGVSSAISMFLKAMANFTGPASVEYMRGPVGQVLGAIGTFSVWQQTIFWAYPIAIITRAVGVFWLVFSISTLNKPLKSDAQKARAF